MPCDPQLSNCDDGNEGHGHVLLGGSDEMNHDNNNHPWEQVSFHIARVHKRMELVLTNAILHSQHAERVADEQFIEAMGACFVGSTDS